MQSVHVDPIDRRLFPNVLIGIMGLSIAGLVVQRLRGSAGSPQAAADEVAGGTQSIASGWRMVAVILAAVGYVVFVEHIGFVLASGLMVGGLCWVFGTPGWKGSDRGDHSLSIDVHGVWESASHSVAARLVGNVDHERSANGSLNHRKGHAAR